MRRPILINAREAGRILGMVPARVIRLARQGDVPCVNLPDDREPKFIEADLLAWVEEHRYLVSGGPVA